MTPEDQTRELLGAYVLDAVDDRCFHARCSRLRATVSRTLSVTCVSGFSTSPSRKLCTRPTIVCGRCTSVMPGHYGDKTMPKKGAKKPGKMMPPGIKKPTKKGK